MSISRPAEGIRQPWGKCESGSVHREQRIWKGFWKGYPAEEVHSHSVDERFRCVFIQICFERILISESIKAQKPLLAPSNARAEWSFFQSYQSPNVPHHERKSPLR